MIKLRFEKKTSNLNSYKTVITVVFKKAIAKITSTIPIDNVTIVIVDAPKYTIPEIGIGGYSRNKKLVYIYLNPRFPNFNKTIKKYLERTIAHELHHCLRRKNPGYGKTLLEALVTEGLADHFEVEISKGAPAQWDKALTSAQQNRLLKRAMREFSNKQYDHSAWFFGSTRRKIPRWTGYSLGFYLVGQHLKATRTKASQLYNLKAKNFVSA